MILECRCTHWLGDEHYIGTKSEALHGRSGLPLRKSSSSLQKAHCPWWTFKKTGIYTPFVFFSQLDGQQQPDDLEYKFRG